MPPESARYDTLRSHCEMLRDQNGPDAVGKMKQFATYFTHGVRNGSRLRADIYHASSTQQILDLVDAFFERELDAAAV